MNKEELKETLKERIASAEKTKEDCFSLNSGSVLGNYHDGRTDGLIQVSNLIDQLDEPEVTEEKAWEVIGAAYADSRKGNLHNPKKLFDEGMEKHGILNTLTFEMQKRNFEGTFNEFIFSLLEVSEKPIVPQFVADWFEESKDYLEGKLFSFIHSIYRKNQKGKPLNELELWLSDFDNDPIETIIKMKYGYEVEKEPLYYMPLPYQSNVTIFYYKRDDGKISFKQGNLMKNHSQFTQEELDKHFPEIKHMAIEVGNE